MSWQWRTMQSWKKSWLIVSKLTWGIWRILTGALENLKYLHFNGLFLIKVYHVRSKKCSGVMFDDTEDWCKIWRNTDLCFQKWHEEFWQIFVQRLENSDFFLESKMVELNQNKNSKQTHRPVALWKLYFTLEINE